MTYPIETLEMIFRAEDVEGLLAVGAPLDEYDSEASQLQAALDSLDERQFSLAWTRVIVARIWQDSFGPFDEHTWQARQPALLSLALRVVKERPKVTQQIGSMRPQLRRARG